MSQRPIFLERITISNFRSHGKSELRLPPEPGVVLLVGMNGLGKTSVFEAIEWTLTNTVRRLEALPLTRGALQDALRRTGSYWKPKVTLDFGAAGRITRDSSHQPSPEEVTRLLAAEGWPHTIADPATYLALTHILPQCPQIRFSQRDPKEQWEMLKVPAGVERLDTLAVRLSGQALQGEFDRSVEVVGKSIVDHQAVIDRWKSMQTEVERLTAIAAGRASLTRQEIEVALLWLQERWQPRRSPGGEGLAAETLARSFQQIGSRLAAEKQRLAALEARIGSGMQIVQEWNDLAQGLATARLARETLAIQSTEAETAARTALEQRDAAATVLARSEQAQAAARRRLAEAQALLAALNGAEETARALATTDAAVAAADQNLAALEANFNASEQLRVQTGTTRDALVAISRQAAQLATLEQRHRAVLVAEEQAVRARQELGELVLQLEQVRIEDRKQAAESRRLQDEITASERRTDQVRVSVQKLSDALAEIAAHLSPSDTVCPVCQHAHPPAELQRLAKQSADAAAPALAALIAETAALRLRLDASAQAQRVAEQQSVTLEEQKSLLEGVVRAAEVDRNELETHPLLAGMRREQIPARLHALADELAQSRTQAEARLRTAEAAIPADAAALRGQIAATRNQRTRLAEEQQRLRTLIEKHNATIRARSALYAEADSSTERLATMIGALHDTAEQMGSQLVEERRQQTSAAQEYRRRDAGRAAVLAQRDQNGQQLRALESSRDRARARWQEAGFADDPAMVTLTERRADLQRDTEAVGESFATLEQLIRAGEVWHHQDQLAALEQTRAQEIAAAGAPDAPTHYQKLLASLQAAQDRLAATQRAKALALRVADALRGAAETYNARVLKPLAARIDSFHRALSPFPEYSFDADLHTFERQRTSFELQLHAPNPGGQEVIQNPQTRLSEGQVSALGVCVLLAASTSYRWSRWRALLLDDPFQHTDLIHSTALIDVLRKLTRLKDGYQIILSTHDLEEAEFIRRKCEAAKVKFLRCTMLGLTPTGLRWESGAEFGPQ